MELEVPLLSALHPEQSACIQAEIKATDAAQHCQGVQIGGHGLQLAVVRPGEPEEAPEPRPTLPRDTGKLGTLADIFGKVKVQR